MGDAIGSKTRVKCFRLSFSTGSASRKSQAKKVESKKPFFDCVRKPDLGFSRKRAFSTDKSDCIRNGPRVRYSIKHKPSDMKIMGHGLVIHTAYHRTEHAWCPSDVSRSISHLGPGPPE